MSPIKTKMVIGCNAEVEKIGSKSFVKKSDKSKVLVGPPESMSKSKKIQLILR